MPHVCDYPMLTSYSSVQLWRWCRRTLFYTSTKALHHKLLGSIEPSRLQCNAQRSGQQILSFVNPDPGVCRDFLRVMDMVS